MRQSTKRQLVEHPERKSDARRDFEAASKSQSPIKIKCAYTELIPPGQLLPNPRNPNKHPASQMKLLVKIIEHQGFRRSIVVSNRSGLVVVGHARLEAARVLKMPEVPVDYQDYDTEADEYADMLADNRLAELAEASLPDLKDLLQELDTGAFDMDLTGFDAETIEQLMTQIHFDLPHRDTQEQIDKSAAELRERFKKAAIEDLSTFMDLVCPECGKEFQIRRADALQITTS